MIVRLPYTNDSGVVNVIYVGFATLRTAVQGEMHSTANDGRT
jgi:hypothetical protein